MHAAHDVVIRDGTVYDRTGGTPFAADVAIDGDRIAAVGAVGERGRDEIDAGGLAVAPGFINMLSWATTSLIADGRSQSDIRQGVKEDVIRRMTGFPAANLKLDRRGLLRPDHFADAVVFDPARIEDHATYTEPQRYATGVAHVLVNGVPVLRDGEHTGARPGRLVFGPARRAGQRAG